MNFTNIKSAIVSGIITGILGMAGYIIGVGDIFKIDVHSILNVGAISALTVIVSLIKASLTTPQGNIAGTSIIIKQM